MIGPFTKYEAGLILVVIFLASVCFGMYRKLDRQDACSQFQVIYQYPKK